MHKNIFFRLTSLLASLLARFRPNFSGSLYSLRLGLLRFIPILTLALLFSFSLFPLLSSPVSQVRAQEPTPTDYDGEIITPRPLFPSPTMEPTKDVNCTGSQPVGWGTVTPDPYWYLNCLQCITPVSAYGTETPYPVSTYMVPLTQTQQAIDGTSTPASTSTPAYTPTSTPNVGTISCNGSGGCTQVNSTTLDLWSVPISSTSGEATTGKKWDLNFSADGTVYVRIEVTASLQVWHAGMYYSGDNFIFTNFNDHTFAFPSDSVLICTGCYARVVPPGVYEFSYPVFAGIRRIGQLYTGLTPWNSYRFTPAHFYVSLVPDFGSTPTPTVTPSAFCGSVSPLSSAVSGNEFALPVPVIGSTYCPVNFKGYTFVGSNFPFDSLFHWPTVVIPKLIVCFQEITFGTLKYFDYEVEIDKLAFVFAAAKLISIFTGGK